MSIDPRLTEIAAEREQVIEFFCAVVPPELKMAMPSVPLLVITFSDNELPMETSVTRIPAPPDPDMQLAERTGLVFPSLAPACSPPAGVVCTIAA